MVIGRQLDAFSAQSGRTRRPLINDLQEAGNSSFASSGRVMIDRRPLSLESQ